MLDTIKQLYNILWFCQKVNIPFDVYAFTEEWHYRPKKNPNGVTKYPQPHYEKVENVFSVGNSFSLLNMLSSEVKNKSLNEQIRNIFRIAYSFNNYTNGNFINTKNKQWEIRVVAALVTEKILTIRASTLTF